LVYRGNIFDPTLELSELANIKYLGVGLIIGIMVTLLGFGIFLILITRFTYLPATTTPVFPTNIPINPSTTPSQRPLPTLTFTPTPTAIVPSTDPIGSPLPATNTPDAVQSTINNGGLIFTGALSYAQQIALYRASLSYVQSTVQGSIHEAKEINGVGYGDPSNICGPLAIAIMQDADLLGNVEVVPHDFWLLNPFASNDQRLLGRVFPTDHFLHIKFQSPLNKTNWHEFPLQPGDFLFIWHGSGGNFDHMLVVTRVDSYLNTYSVTNYGTPDGFVIAETLLYNPSDPKAGIFHTWTQERNAILGSTGFGGFDLWRPLTP
jgi:hypothetical protein